MLDGTQEREKTEPREKTLEHTPTPESEHKGHPFSKEMRTLWFQLEDTVLSIGTLLLFDPILFPKYEVCLLIGSIHSAKEACLLYGLCCFV